MRFDDSLDTALAGDISTPVGARSTWRQLVDLIGRRRAPPTAPAMARLALLRERVEQPVRAASARGLAFADPPAELVRFFAEDHFEVAAPVLRIARLEAAEWVALLPGFSPVARSVLRHRRDLPEPVARALQAFGAVDFVLAGEAGDAGEQAAPEGDRAAAVHPAAPQAPLASPFVAVGTVARELPVVAEALRQADTVPDSTAPDSIVQATRDGTGPFRIADLVARIDAYRKRKGDGDASPQPQPQPQPASGEASRANQFAFETDETGVVRWVAGVSRGALIGLSLELATLPQGTRIDGTASGAFRRRQGFTDARLVVGGDSDAAGSWRMSAVPAFDERTGRFMGYRGTARRPRIDEAAERPVQPVAGQALRQLVHELRTPANAIAGFAEMIETQLLGAVPDPYRQRAQVIRSQAHDLLGAIDDLDTAARIDAHALELRPRAVALKPLLDRIATDLAPLAELRGTRLALDPVLDAQVLGDDRALDRLFGRLMAALVSAGAADERIDVAGERDGDQVVVTFTRPRALALQSDDALFAIDAEREADLEGAPLLGTGFALRLARNLAGELGGSLAIGAERLTMRLPAAVDQDVEQASIN